jgi:hypothetical protein
VSSATETTASCDTCREKGTAQSIVLLISVAPMIASFFMRFSLPFYTARSLRLIWNNVSKIEHQEQFLQALLTRCCDQADQIAKLIQR